MFQYVLYDVICKPKRPIHGEVLATPLALTRLCLQRHLLVSQLAIWWNLADVFFLTLSFGISKGFKGKSRKGLIYDWWNKYTQTTRNNQPHNITWHNITINITINNILKCPGISDAPGLHSPRCCSPDVFVHAKSAVTRFDGFFHGL